MTAFKTILSRVLSQTPLQYWPVRVRQGIACGARWTLLPHSANWRLGGERDIELALRLHGGLCGAVCWDLGAHFGIHTVGLAMQVGSKGQVSGFEPDPDAFARLKRHVRMNSLNQVKLFNAAVSEVDGAGQMIVSGGLGSTFTHMRYEDESVHLNTPVISIHTVKLDSLVNTGEISAPDFIKVDVQGHGAKALRGAMKTLRSKRPTILFSSHGPHESEGVHILARELAYRCFDVEGREISWLEDHSGTAVLMGQ